MESLKVLKHGIKVDGKYIPCFYSIGGLRNHSENTISVRPKSILNKLPKELTPKNDSDSMTDYFVTDRAYLTPDHKYYQNFLTHAKI